MGVRGPKTELTLRSVSRTSDGMGGYTEVLTPLRRIQGSLYTLSMSERMSADKETVFATHRFLCEYPFGELDIIEAYWFTDDKRGKKYQVKPVRDVANKQIRLQIDLLEVD